MVNRRHEMKSFEKSGLKYWKVKEYVSLLILSNLISYNEIDQTDKATAKGLHYLNLYNQMSAHTHNPNLFQLTHNPNLFQLITDSI